MSARTDAVAALSEAETWHSEKAATRFRAWLADGGSLNVSCCLLRALPAELQHVTDLEIFDCSCNYLRELPEWIGALAALKTLHVYKNDLRYLPKSLGLLKDLSDLVCAGNLLSELPDELRDMKALEALDVSYNPLTEIPDDLRQLKTLLSMKTLFKTLPMCLTRMYTIKSINFSETDLSEMSICAEIFQMPELQTVWLDVCNLGVSQLCDMAKTLPRSTSICSIHIHKNPGSLAVEVTEAFAQALRSNASLRMLSLAGIGEIATDTTETSREIDAAILRNKRRQPPPEPYRPLVKSTRKQ